MLAKILAKLNNRSVRQILGNTSWLLSERLVRLGIGVGANIWIARYLGPSNFGLLNYAIAFALLFRGLASGGLDGIATRELVAKRDESNAIMGTVFAIRAVAGVVAFTVTLITCHFMQAGDGTMFLAVAVSAAGTLVLSFDVIDFWFQSRVESKFAVLARSSGFVLAQLASLMLVFRHSSVTSIAIAQSSELLIAAAGLALTYRLTGGRFLGWQFRADLAWMFLKKSWPLILSGMGVIVYMKTAQIVLGQIKGNHEVGIYSVAARLAEVWYFLPTLVASSVFPKLVENYERNEELYHARLQKLLNLVCWMAFAVAVPTCLLSNFIIHTLYGAEFARAGAMLSVHIWGCCFIFMGAILSKTLIIEGILIFSLIRHVLGAAVNVALNLYLIPKYGGVGASIATVVSYATAAYLSSFIYKPTVRSGRQMTIALLQPILLPVSLIRGWLQSRHAVALSAGSAET